MGSARAAREALHQQILILQHNNNTTSKQMPSNNENNKALQGEAVWKENRTTQGEVRGKGVQCADQLTTTKLACLSCQTMP
jgi:hypothetical protein